MPESLEREKKNATVATTSLFILVLAFNRLPDMAMRHGIPAVWAVVPLSLLSAAAIVNVLVTLTKLRRLSAQHD